MYSYEQYNNVLDKFLNNGYSFKSFSEELDGNKNIYLRHDIDSDIWNTKKIAELEKEKGVKSTYFVQFNSDMYNAMSKESIDILNYIVECGHEVGLHIDAKLYSDYEALEKGTTTAYEFYSQYIQLSPVISFHRPADFILNSDIKIDGFVNTYEDRFFNNLTYFSDSNGRKFWDEKFDLAIEKGESMQLVTHPFWWSPHEKTIYETFMLFRKRISLYYERALSNNIKSYKSYTEWMNIR